MLLNNTVKSSRRGAAKSSVRVASPSGEGGFPSVGTPLARLPGNPSNAVAQLFKTETQRRERKEELLQETS
jgi:hypothetical protein